MLGLVYALNDMCLCIGFTLGPILGPVMEAAFGHGAWCVVLHVVVSYDIILPRLMQHVLYCFCMDAYCTIL